MISEQDYRKLIQSILAKIEAAFEAVDPDVVECEQQFGALTLKLASGARCILSAQPSVRQLWMAVASRGIAHHFSYDEARGQWLDDKGKGIEVLAYLRGYLKEEAGLEVAF